VAKARAKKTRAKKAKVEETPEGVEVTFPGRVLPPALPPRRRLRHCPACGEGPVTRKDRYGTSKTAYLYECPVCVDPETCRPTRWKDPRG
jgi:hypothetical protein